MSKGKSRAIIIAIVVVVALLGVISMTGFPINETSYVMPIYKAIQLGSEATGGVSASYKPAEEGKAPTSSEMKQLERTMRKRLESNGFNTALVSQVGDDQIRIEYPELGIVNHDPYTAMLAKRSHLQMIDPDGNEIFNTNNFDEIDLGQDPLTGKYGVTYRLNKAGRDAMKKATTKHAGGDPFIVNLDGESIAAIKFEDPVNNGEGLISGEEMEYEGAVELLLQLQGGSLPFELERTDLSYFSGKISRDDMFRSLLITFTMMLVAAIAIIVVYRKNGMAAAIAIAVYTFLYVLAIATIPSIKVSYASIAGIISAFLVAISSVIVVLESSSEEILEGKTVSGAIGDGFKRAFPLLVDIHVIMAVMAVAFFLCPSVWLRDFSVTLLLGLAFNVCVLLTLCYACQYLMANIDARPESFTRMGKVPELTTTVKKKKNKSAGKA